VNFLAHVLLAGARPSDQIGGLLGDFVKGPLPCGLPPELARGVALHRFVDRSTDRHPLFIRSCQRISPERRRFAGIIIDMVYDHFLATHWHCYCNVPLTRYSQDFYRLLTEYLSFFPEGSFSVLAAMQRQDWLCGYADLAMIGRSLDHISRVRLKRVNSLAGAVIELETHYADLEQDFCDFMPDMLRACEQWLGSETLADTMMVSPGTSVPSTGAMMSSK